MKKIFMMAAFAGMLFASCSSNQTEATTTTTDSTQVTTVTGSTGAVVDTAKVDTTVTVK